MTGSADGRNRMVATMLLVLIILSLANLAMTFWLLHQDRQPISPLLTAPFCQAIPTRLILEDPQCADKLLRAMNVTNVRISSREKPGDRPFSE
jgi:hypothetical protein